MHQFLKFIFGLKFYMFRTVPLSIIRNFSLYTQQWYLSYTFADSSRAGSGRNVLILRVILTVKNSWWCTEELSETCRILFQKWIWETGASSRFYFKNLSRSTVTWTLNTTFLFYLIHFLDLHLCRLHAIWGHRLGITLCFPVLGTSIMWRTKYWYG